MFICLFVTDYCISVRLTLINIQIRLFSVCIYKYTTILINGHIARDRSVKSLFRRLWKEEAFHLIVLHTLHKTIHKYEYTVCIAPSGISTYIILSNLNTFSILSKQIVSHRADRKSMVIIFPKHKLKHVFPFLFLSPMKKLFLIHVVRNFIVHGAYICLYKEDLGSIHTRKQHLLKHIQHSSISIRT